ncbi:FepA family TonB-dependent siderophore receptor [Nitratireductor indicus]|uniref:FepA family TonB-dependent siderophore receptor n=1 Tax=Nitratireductor indicus TaxID=721133 RepID=UPI0028743E91|nr:FepA family TonB-dependent siderophore receptor [Nitratireductor indicus]MDS1138035.1 FepA family TonB-dependent siderophore receptor [Nitratireductor indicus]
MSRHLVRGGCLTALALFLPLPATAQDMAEANNGSETTLLETIVIQAASEELKQALGVSTITAEDLEDRPVANDISEIVRRMPGVNLTGNSSTGIRGNNRQIDIRGMGPENVLILIDGKPVLSRNSVRYGRSGERDTRGDSNWVPAEAIERIEVIRGPAAARYGSGASGGVVNIITKRPETTTYGFSTYIEIPEHKEEGGSKRANFVVGGPLSDVLSYRLYGGIAQTDADDPDINAEATDGDTRPAGHEGVKNYDLNGLLSWQIDPQHRIDFEAGYSRQSNIYAGDTQYDSPTDIINDLADGGAETNRMTRYTLSATHHGEYDFGESTSFIQWEKTINRRLLEGLAGSGEGTINTDSEFGKIYLDNITAKSEFNIPLSLLWDQTVTLGVEYRGEFMKDGVSIRQSGADDDIDLGTPVDPTNRDPNISANLVGLYVEDNIAITERLMLTPGLRMDYHDEFGFNLSPSLNASYKLTEEITIKGGVARAFKAPNLYQLNPNYVYYTRGYGCPPGYGQVGGIGCYVVGNPDLEPEISLNKEIGVSYANVNGWNATLTYFHNDYDNRIAPGVVPIRYADEENGRGRLFRWENSGPAVISGLEGSLAVPLAETLTWTTNATWMLQSKEKSTGQPLSLVPKYTVNTALRWEPLDTLGVTLSATHYGKIEPRTAGIVGGEYTDPEDLETRGAYTIVNVGADYQINESLKLTAGVNNLFDERLFRTGKGANTYNEPGRSYYLSLSGRF